MTADSTHVAVAAPRHLGDPCAAQTYFHIGKPFLELDDGGMLRLRREVPAEGRQRACAEGGDAAENGCGYHPSASRRSEISFSYASSIAVDAHSSEVRDSMTDSPTSLPSKCCRTTSNPPPGAGLMMTRVSDVGGLSSLMRKTPLAIRTT